VLLQAVAILAKRLPRVLRVQVSVFSRDRREEIEAILKELVFARTPPASSYRYTLVIDLKPTEDEIFASLDKGARYEIRRTAKKQLRCLVIDNPMYGDRLRELQEEALHRTDGQTHAENWQGILEMSREHPELSRVFGMFLGDDSAPQEMAAFSWVLNNGDHGEYRAAGSTRRIEAPVPLGYLPVWEMIRWAKATGSDWFDMGGVTLEGADQNALEGISRFKRTFSRNVAEVGSEWVMEPSPGKAKIASVISNSTEQLRRLVKKWR
jgi:lipid II:glycine glycyltransferase (peptidoglycan interpeptide bridge formation enzyme)